MSFIILLIFFWCIIWLLYFTWLSFLSVKKIASSKKVFSANKSRYFALGMLAFCFLLVPVIQTLRYPYFSSMKSMFLLPGIFIMLMVFSRIFNTLKVSNILCYGTVAVNAVYAIILIIMISLVLSNSLYHPSGPIWPLLY